MELYIGGCAQGKLEYVLRTHQGEPLEVIDGGSVGEPAGTPGNKVVFHHFHLWVKKLLEENKDPRQQTEQLIKQHDSCIIISDEVGNGIVPMEQKERDYREELGRIQIELAAKAERVERVVCGIGQRLK